MTQVAEPITERAGGATGAVVPHWIGGARVAGTSGRRGPVFNPATGAIAREVDFASVEEVDAAVALLEYTCQQDERDARQDDQRGDPFVGL